MWSPAHRSRGSPRGAGLRYAVGEGVPQGAGRLGEERLGAATEGHGPGGEVAELAAHGVAAPEPEVADGGAAADGERVGHVRPGGRPVVAVLDQVPAVGVRGRVGAAVAVGAEGAAGGGAAAVLDVLGSNKGIRCG